MLLASEGATLPPLIMTGNMELMAIHFEVNEFD